MTGNTFSRDELVEAFAGFEKTVDRAAQTRDWDPWVDQYTDDVLYIDWRLACCMGKSVQAVQNSAGTRL